MLLTKRLIIILFVVVFDSCKTNIPNNFNAEDPSNSFKVPIIIDTLQRTEELKKYLSISVSYPNIEAVNPFGDTCFLKNNFYDIWDTSINRNVEQRADGLQILVDTTQSITIKSDRS